MPTPLWSGEERHELFAQAHGGAGWDEHSGADVAEELRQSVDVGSHDDRYPGRHRLERREWRALPVAGQDCHLTGTQERRHVGAGSEESDRVRKTEVGCSGLQLGARRPVAGERRHSRRSSVRPRLQEDVVSLLRYQPGAQDVERRRVEAGLRARVVTVHQGRRLDGLGMTVSFSGRRPASIRRRPIASVTTTTADDARSRTLAAHPVSQRGLRGRQRRPVASARRGRVPLARRRWPGCCARRPHPVGRSVSPSGCRSSRGRPSGGRVGFGGRGEFPDQPRRGRRPANHPSSRRRSANRRRNRPRRGPGRVPRRLRLPSR